jgi:PAS domain S-box-containing protein
MATADATAGRKFRRDGLLFSAIAASPMSMVVTDPDQPDNPIIFANRGFLAMTGYPPSQVIGRNCRFLQGPATDAATVAALRQAVCERRSIATEVLNYRRDGSPFWSALFISPVLDAQGSVHWLLGSQLDVTRRREAEAELRQVQTLEALGQLASGIAHDFNNLLMVIAGSLDMLDGAVEAARRRRLIDRGQEAVARAKRLTGQLRSFGRRQALQSRPVDLNALVAAVAERLRPSLPPGIALELHLAEGLAPCHGDPAGIEQALASLAANAAEAMPQGGRLAFRTAGATVPPAAPDGLAAGAYAMLEVRDTGHGMSPAVLRRAAEPFFTTKSSGVGAGLGLSTVHGFARQSGGRLRLTSQVGRGTVARLLLPAPAEAPVPPPRGGETVLLLADDPVALEAAGTLLASLGYRTLAAGSTAEAMALLEETPADLVVAGLLDEAAAAILAGALARRQPGPRLLIAEAAPLLRPGGLAALPAQVRQALDRPVS